MATITLINPAPNDNRTFISDAVQYDEKLPLGICYIDAYVSQHGHNSSIIDAYGHGYNSDDVLHEFALAPTDIVGVNMLTPTEDVASLILSKIKSAFPDVITVAGGMHPSLCPEGTLTSHPHIDISVIGEGEQTALALMNAFDATRPARRSSFAALHSVDGIAFRDGVRIHKTPPRGRISDLDDLPFPSYHKLPLHRYWHEAKIFCMLTSRGCSFNCIFCSSKSLWERRVAFRSVDSVLDEIVHWQNEFSVGYFYFNDLTFTINRKRLHKFCHGILDRGIFIHWKCLVRPDTLDIESIELMYRAGCREMAMGIESGDSNTQIYIRKNLDLEQVRQRVAYILRKGITLIGLFIIGFPNEGPSHILNTINYIISLRDYGFDHFDLFQATAYPGTELYERACADHYVDANRVTITEDGNSYLANEEMRKQFRRHSFVPIDSVNAHIDSTRFRDLIHLVYQKFDAREQFSEEDLRPFLKHPLNENTQWHDSL